MVTDRPYREAMSTGEAVAELRANAGTQFDPCVVGQLVALVETSPELYAAEEAIAL
jgi:HD-GYP domain-containing protein (c-di-GMP phosphodiesterase class II)